MSRPKFSHGVSFEGVDEMKSKEFKKLREAATVYNEGRVDVVVPAKEIEFVDPQNVKIPGLGRQQISPWGVKSICEHESIPMGYLKKCKENGHPELVATNVNQWLKSDDREFLIRSYNGVVQGVLSTRYVSFSHLEAADVIEEIHEIVGFEIKASWISPESMFIRVSIPSTETDIKVGEAVSGGFDFVNSEVGKFAFCVNPKVMRLVCSNGMVVADPRTYLEPYRHIHLSAVDVNYFHTYMEETIRKMPDGIGTVLKQYTEAGKVEFSSDEMWSLLQLTKTHTSWKFTQDVFRFWSADERFTIQLHDRIKYEDFGFGYEERRPSLAGYWNAMTQKVQDSRMAEEERQKVENFAAWTVFRMLSERRAI